MTDFDDLDLLPDDDNDDDGDDAPTPRPRWVGLIALLAVVGLVAGILAVFFDDDDDGVRRDTPDVTAPADIPAAIDEIEAFVAAERGLPFLREVRVELADDDEFEQRLLVDFEEEVDELVQFGSVLHALGLLDTAVDPVDSYRRLLGAGVVGFYDPETDELVVRGRELTPYVRSIVAHELVHALDDQHFELHRPELEDAADESSFGFSALVEGNARRVEDAYVASLSPDEQLAATDEALGYGLDADLLSAPPILLGLLQAPYVAGPDFVADVIGSGGQPALDAAMAAPPISSEQVLDPATYLAGEGALGVREPPADGDVIDQGTLGALLLGALFVDDPVDIVIGDPPSLDGWGGDRYVTWTGADGAACIRADIVGDDDGDTAAIAAQLADWADDAPRGVEASVEGGAAGAPITLTSCAAR